MPSLFAFSARAILRHSLTALWMFLLTGLAVEWLLPGTVTSRLPILPLAFAGTIVTLLLGPAVARQKTRWEAALGLILPLGGGAAAALLFAVREPSSLVRIAAFLAWLLVLGLFGAAWLPDDAKEAG